MKAITIRLSQRHQQKLQELARHEGRSSAAFARQKLIEIIEQEAHGRHRAAMEEMVRQAIAHNEVRDAALERASLIPRPPLCTVPRSDNQSSDQSLTAKGRRS